MSRARKQPVETRDAAPTPSAGNTRPKQQRQRKQRVDAFQRALPLDIPTTTPSLPVSSGARSVERLWFCAYLPRLPLEAFAACDDGLAVVEEQHGMHRVLLADAQATAAGVLPGQSANAALALLPTLVIEERNPLREQQVLETLAAWLEQYSSFVSIAADDVLLLEIAGSLKLFGGLRKLRRRIVAGLKGRGFAASPAIAPTPLAATWLARDGRRACIREPGNLLSALRALPLACLDWPAATTEALTGMGIGSIGDCLRLPRDGFARRFGAGRLLELDRALGCLPDPRPSWRAPERFLADHEMTEEQADSECLLAICRELLVAHERFLLLRQLGTQRLRFTFFHLKAPATRLSLGSVAAEHSSGHWFDLLGMRFERLELPEPVIAIRLEGGRTQAVSSDTAKLMFHHKRTTSVVYSMTQLAERLVARIGDQSVHRINTAADHRPHFAWRLSEALAGKAGDALSAVQRRLKRPLWMLPEPLLLETEQGLPRHQGRLTLIRGPERIETGWWDEHGVARDYYTAVNPRGIRLWVFRDRRYRRSAREVLSDGQREPQPQSSWYLHGIFG